MSTWRPSPGSCAPAEGEQDSAFPWAHPLCQRPVHLVRPCFGDSVPFVVDFAPKMTQAQCQSAAWLSKSRKFWGTWWTTCVHESSSVHTWQILWAEFCVYKPTTYMNGVVFKPRKSKSINRLTQMQPKTPRNLFLCFQGHQGLGCTSPVLDATEQKRGLQATRVSSEGQHRSPAFSLREGSTLTSAGHQLTSSSPGEASGAIPPHGLHVSLQLVIVRSPEPSCKCTHTHVRCTLSIPSAGNSSDAEYSSVTRKHSQ